MAPPYPRRFGLIATYFGLYASQGLVHGFQGTALLTWLLAAGIDASNLAAGFALRGLPWTLKPLFGPLVDRLVARGPHALRHTMVVCQLAQATGALALLFAPDPRVALSWTLPCLALQSLGASFQDVVVDGSALVVVPSMWRGRANAAMACGAACGGLLGAGGLSFVLSRAGLAQAVRLEVLALTLLALVPLLTWQRLASAAGQKWASHSAGTRTMDAWLGSLLRRLLHPTSLGVLIAAMVAATAWAVVDFLLREEAVRRLGWTSEACGLLNGVWAPLVGLVGLVAGGMATDRLRPERSGSMAALGCAAVLGIGAVAHDALRHPAFLTALLCSAAFCLGAVQAALLSFFMCFSRTPVASATLFAIYMALLNFAGSAGQGLAGLLADKGLLATSMACAGAVAVCASAVLRRARCGQRPDAEPDQMHPV